jgi:group I intron endonuclease
LCIFAQNIYNMSEAIFKERGVYKITFSHSNKCYIGSTCSHKGFKKRWDNHLAKLKNGKHHNSHLQRTYNKYPNSIIIFDVVESLDTCNEHILRREEYWISYYNAVERGYNLSAHADDSRRILEFVQKSKKRLLQYDLEGNFIKEWESFVQARQFGYCVSFRTNYAKSTGITFSKDSQWTRWVPHYPLIIPPFVNPANKKVLCYKIDGSFYRIYDSLSEFSEEWNVNHGFLSHHMLGESRYVKGFVLKPFTEEYPLFIEPVCREHPFQFPILLIEKETGKMSLFYSINAAVKEKFGRASILKSINTNCTFRCRSRNNTLFYAQKLSYQEYLSLKYEKTKAN